MVTEDDKIKLIDFGFAIEDIKQKNNLRVGTPRYMSPEVLDRKYSAPGDIWALGVTMYFLLTAEFPFNAQTMDGLIQQVKSGKFSMPKQLSKEC